MYFFASFSWIDALLGLGYGKWEMGNGIISAAFAFLYALTGHGIPYGYGVRPLGSPSEEPRGYIGYAG